MPTHKQTMLEPVTTTRDLGASDTQTLKNLFDRPPWGDEDAKGKFNDVLIGTINDGGHTFLNHKHDYALAPEMEKVDSGGGEGQPATPFTPDPGSPGAGSINPKDLPGTGYKPPTSTIPGSGLGSSLDPKSSSQKIGGLTLGSYGLGRSYEGSAGSEQ